ncbi:MAG TPA: hypothetical protein VGQ58_06410 [Candidatus Limnocylindrales bacterium]|nr:hypothetical protein [Candidatus Limnocylindrales bacterium]
MRELTRFGEEEWLKLADVEGAVQADPAEATRSDRIYRGAYATARRRGQYDVLGRSLTAARDEAVRLASAAAGPEALAAHHAVDAVTRGRGLVVDPAAAAIAERYWRFADAATNAVSAAVLRPYISRQDFEYLWRPYETIITFGTSIEARTVAPSTQDDRLLFGPNGAQVAWFLTLASSADLRFWEAVFAAQLQTLGTDQEEYRRRLRRAVEAAGKRGVRTGMITLEDVTEAKRIAETGAEAALPTIVDAKMAGSDHPRERVESVMRSVIVSGANAIATLLVVRPFLDEAEYAELSAPYVRTMPALR